ncbi:hypothetical protein [Myxococcus faecalis]|uniref:hypothetical protein n=1 Tax=Myxococcus faecalis TaxID=3115646 RepID=UPI003CF36E53
MFDGVMRNPEAVRGLNVDATCRLLSEAARSAASGAEYVALLRELEEIYLREFLHTASVDPTFVSRVHESMRKFR